MHNFDIKKIYLQVLVIVYVAKISDQLMFSHQLKIESILQQN